jgi:putative PIN family toxin of toxin-antitoxin system
VIRAVLDTNIIISALLWGGQPEQIFEFAHDERFAVLSSEAVVAELESTLSRTKFAAHFLRRNRSYAASMNEYRSLVEFVDPAEVPDNAVRDPKDRIILGCAVGGRADYIISGDKDLLVLGSYESIPSSQRINF